VEGCSHLSVGENGEREETSAGIFIFTDGGERRGGPGPARRRQDGSPEWLDHGEALGLLSWVTNRWASVSVFKTGMSPSGGGPHCSPIRPITNGFLFF
jgi:hypothetical protein